MPFTSTGFRILSIASHNKMPVTSHVLSTETKAPSTSIRWNLQVRCLCVPKQMLSAKCGYHLDSHLNQPHYARLSAGVSHPSCMRFLPGSLSHHFLTCRGTDKAYPKVCVDVLLLDAIKFAKRATPKPLTSDKRWAASVRIARLHLEKLCYIKIKLCSNGRSSLISGTTNEQEKCHINTYSGLQNEDSLSPEDGLTTGKHGEAWVSDLFATMPPPISTIMNTKHIIRAIMSFHRTCRASPFL